MEIGIPGQTSNSGIDVKELIKDLVEAEKQPIERLENQIDNTNVQSKLWSELDRDLNLFGDYAKKLYSFDNPFDVRSAESSNEKVVTVETIRGTPYGEYDVTVKQVATADRWVSDSLAAEYEVSQGYYIFNVGDTQISFSFDGGSLEKFATKLTKEGENYISARIVQQGTQADVVTFLLEGLVEGKNFAMSLEGEAEKFSKEIGLQAARPTYKATKVFVEKSWINNIHSDKTSVVLQEGSDEFTLLSGAITDIKTNVQGNIRSVAEQDLKLDITVIATHADVSQQDQHMTKIEDSLRATLQDASVLGIKRSDILGDQVELERDEMPIIFSGSSANSTVLQQKKESEIIAGEAFTLTLALDKIYDKATDALYFTLINPFSDYDLKIKDSKIVNEGTVNNAVMPKNPLSLAQNTIIEFNGVDFERDTKAVGDLIPGVTLHVKRASEDPVLISINANEKIIKEDIINFVGAYNQVMRKIHIFTSTNETVLDDMVFVSTEERDDVRQNMLGKLSGNFNLISLENRMQTIMTKQYSNTVDAKIKFLRDVGIASNLTIGGTSTNTNRRYLDIQEDTLDKVLQTDLDEVARLFRSDIDKDMIIDSGIAFEAKDGIELFVRTGGIIDQKKRTLNGQVQRDQRQVTRYNEKLVDYEIDLKRKFGNMERSLNQLQDVTDSINNLSGKK